MWKRGYPEYGSSSTMFGVTSEQIESDLGFIRQMPQEWQLLIDLPKLKVAIRTGPTPRELARDLWMAWKADQ